MLLRSYRHQGIGALQQEHPLCVPRIATVRGDGKNNEKRCFHSLLYDCSHLRILGAKSRVGRGLREKKSSRRGRAPE